MGSKYLLLIIIILLVSCGQKQPTDKEIEKAFQEINNETLWKELEDMVYNDQYHRTQISGLDKSALNHQKQKDSLWKLQLAIDHRHTQRMIEITKKYGFPDPDRTGKPIGVWALFHHAPEEYREEIKSLIEREYQAKRIDSTAYRMTLWHLNGRKGLPEGTGLQIIDNR